MMCFRSDTIAILAVKTHRAARRRRARTTILLESPAGPCDNLTIRSAGSAFSDFGGRPAETEGELKMIITSWQRKRAALLSIVAVMTAAVPPLRGTEISWVPVSATGTHAIVGRQITIPLGGQQVTLELRISGWDPDMDGDPQIGAYQATLDAAGFSSGTGDSLMALTTPTVEAGAFIISKRCTVGQMVSASGQNCSGGQPCPPNEFCIDNQDFVLANLSPLTAISFEDANYKYGGVSQALNTGRVDQGLSYYGGTLILEVPPGAMGTYTIGFISDVNFTFLNDAQALLITPVDLLPALITIGCTTNADCNDGSMCTTDACLRTNVCQNTPTYDVNTSCCHPGTGALTPLSDGDDCTADVCDPQTGSVSHPAEPDGTACDDGIVCTLDDTCESGQCTPGPPDVPSSNCSGDFDFDGDRSLDDHLALFDCLLGPAQVHPGGDCIIADFDGDGFVDLADWRGFQNVFAGP